jgi:glycosyltransferase involved in cell wall biosynthesis
MKVLHVMGNFAASGAERQLAGTMRAARLHGYWEPTLCVLRTGSPYADELQRAGVDVIQLSFRSDADIRRLLSVRRIARCYDVIHSSLWGANVLTRAALLGDLRSCVVISERRVEPFRHGLQRSVDNFLRHRADAFIGNSADVGAFISTWHGASPDMISVIPNGIDRSVFYPLPDRTSASGASLPIRLGAAGRLVPLKGFDVLIESLRALTASTSVTLSIVGSGPERKRLETIATGLPVHFLGEIGSPNDMATFMRSLDIFVHPSYSEGLPNVLLEAQACGIPVVATTAPGVQEAVKVGYFAAPGDVQGLTRAILCAIDNPQPPDGSGIADFKSVAASHSTAFADALVRRARRSRSFKARSPR